MTSRLRTKSRTMIYLDRDELETLRAEARAQRISLAELLRRLVRQHLERRVAPPPPSAAAHLKIVALGSSGRADVSARHDDYLGEALQREHAR